MRLFPTFRGDVQSGLQERVCEGCKAGKQSSKSINELGSCLGLLCEHVVAATRNQKLGGVILRLKS